MGDFVCFQLVFELFRLGIDWKLVRKRLGF